MFVCGLHSSAYTRDSTSSSPPIAANSQIFENDLLVTQGRLVGDSGLFRLWFSFTTGVDYNITITKKGAADLLGFPLKVNGDNSFVLKDNGYYRFDMNVEPGDLINLSSNVEITKVNELRLQQIQIGA